MRRWKALMMALLFVAVPGAIALSQGTDNTPETAGIDVQGFDSDTEGVRLTFDSFGALEEDAPNPNGGIAPAGTRFTDIFTLDNFSEFGLSDLTFEQIQTLSGQPVEDAPLTEATVIERSTPEEIADAVPGLNERAIESVPVFDELAEAQGVDRSDTNGTIGEIVPRITGTIGEAAEITENFSISDIQGLFEAVKVGSLPGGGSNKIGDIPGLGGIAIIDITSIKDLLAPFDIGWAGGENFDSPCEMPWDCEEKPTVTNSASGGWQQGEIPCGGPDCSHIEIRRRGGPLAQVNYKWFTKEQEWVPGGNGWLCLTEPVGRYPLGIRRFKFVVTGIDEKTGEAKFGLYVYVDGPFGLQSANCFGPFPIPIFGTRKEGQLVLFGLSRRDPVDQLATLAQQLRRASSGAGPSRGRTPEQPSTPPPDIGPPEECPDVEIPQFGRPAVGTFTSGWGWRWGRFHSGVDIANAIGTPVVASWCGRLVANYWDPRGGGIVYKVDHGNGFSTQYLHNNDYSQLPIGAVVKKGQYLGPMGSTGHSTGPHTHFEIIEYGQKVNPKNYIRLN